MDGGRSSSNTGTEVSAIVASVLLHVQTPHGHVSKVANVTSYHSVLLTVVKIRQLVSDWRPPTHKNKATRSSRVSAVRTEGLVWSPECWFQSLPGVQRLHSREVASQWTFSPFGEAYGDVPQVALSPPECT